MITLKTAGIGAGLITGATGIGFAVAYSAGVFDSNIQITNLLDEENKYSLLSTSGTEEKQDWDKAWGEYKKDNTGAKEGKDSWKVAGWKETDVKDAPEGFKQACNERKDNKVKNKEDEEYKKFVRYCTRPRTISEFLKKEGFKALNTNGEDDAWTQRFTKYQKGTEQLPNLKLPATGSPEKTFQDLKKGCESALKLKISDEKYATTIGPVKKWCHQ